MSLTSSPEFRVGALVIGISILIAYISLQLSESPDFSGRPHPAWFIADTAEGLIVNGRVKMAGIPVGMISKITLQDGRARVEVLIDPKVPLRESAVVELRAVGILGDRHVELDPGSVLDPPLRRNGQIVNVRGAGSFENVLDQVGGIAESLQEIANKLAMAVEGEGDTEHVLGRILVNFERATSDLASITSENKDELGQIVSELSSITRAVNRVVVSSGDDKGLEETWSRLASSLEKLEATTANIQGITDRISSGEGTLGRLIHDESTINEINAAVENVNSILGGAHRMETSLDFGTEYYAGLDSWRSYVGVRIQPGLDRFYLAGIVDDPTGLVQSEEIRTIEDDGTESVRRVDRTNYHEPKLNLLLGQKFYNLTILGGLYESTGGLGADYDLWRNRLQASVMAFRFDQVNLRASLRYQPVRGVFLNGGVNDVFDNSGNFSTFFGAGILLTNDDIKLLISGSAL